MMANTKASKYSLLPSYIQNNSHFHSWFIFVKQFVIIPADVQKIVPDPLQNQLTNLLFQIMPAFEELLHAVNPHF